MVASQPAQRQKAYSAIDKGLAGGDHGHRLCVLSSSQEPLFSLLGTQMHRALASQRVLTINLGTDRPYGVYDDIPAGFATGGELSDHLTKLSKKLRGTAYRHYLQWLVGELQSDRHKLAGRVEKSLKNFRIAAEVDGSNGEAKWRADIFGIVDVAAVLARKAGALPSDKPFTAAFSRESILWCYNLHLGALPSDVPFNTRLLELVEDPRTG